MLYLLGTHFPYSPSVHTLTSDHIPHLPDTQIFYWHATHLPYFLNLTLSYLTLHILLTSTDFLTYLTLILYLPATHLSSLPGAHSFYLLSTLFLPTWRLLTYYESSFTYLVSFSPFLSPFLSFLLCPSWKIMCYYIPYLIFKKSLNPFPLTFSFLFFCKKIGKLSSALPPSSPSVNSAPYSQDPSITPSISPEIQSYKCLQRVNQERLRIGRVCLRETCFSCSREGQRLYLWRDGRKSHQHIYYCF